MTWYRDGSINLTAGSNAVMGTGTAWLNLVLAGEGLDAPDGRVYEVAEVVSNSHLRLTNNYLGATAAGAAYQIIPNASMTKVLTRRVSDLLSRYETELPQALAAKVDVVQGKGLSSNDYTNDERVKLANIQAAATKNLADAVLLERSNHTGGFNGFGVMNDMRNSSAKPFGLPPSAFFGNGTYSGLALGTEIGIPEMGYGTGRVDAQWTDSSAGYGVMRSFESNGGRRYTCYATSADTWSPWRETTHRANMYGTQPLSTISDAGTAASRNVQSSQVDVTAGHLMAVGAFGLGKPNVVSNMDMNAITQYPTGMSHYYVNNALNGPYEAFYGYVDVNRIDGSYMIQVCTAVGEGTVFKRVTNNGVKGRWDKVIDTTSAVGAIAAGSIIERGSNANGEYVKFADGTMNCTHKIAGVSPANASSVVNIYRSNSVPWVFPAVFVDTPSVGHSESSGIGLCWTALGNAAVSASGTSFTLYSMAQYGTAVVGLSAKGRWK